MGDIGQGPFRLRVDMTTLLYLIACLMSPSPLINLAESRVIQGQFWHGVVLGIVGQERIVMQVGSRGNNGIRSAKAYPFAFIFPSPLSGLFGNRFGHWHNRTEGIEAWQEEGCLFAR